LNHSMGDDLTRGLVIKSTGSRYRVADEGGRICECIIKGKFRVEGIRTTNPVTVGDYVHFTDGGKNNPGIIKSIEERKNYIIRKSSKLSKESQIIAANIDQAVLICTIREPEVKLEFIDRFLVSAESFRIPVVLLFNKIDIYTEEDLRKLEYLISVYSKIGYECYSISLVGDTGTDKLINLVRNRITLVSGNSGVGKSTLLNRIDPSFNIRVEEISDYHKQGRHTTTFAEMYPLGEGGYLIDTPGIRGFGMIDMHKEEIYHFFPEIFRASEKCKYYNCLHINEPGCRVKELLEKGEIEWFRYRSYLNIFEDSNSKYR
jgi:ribosome biogenesis GTPase